MKRLRAELEAAGAFEHREAAGWAKFAFALAALVLACVGVARGPAWAWAALVPIAAVAAMTATLIGHEGSHGSFSSRPASNRLLVHVTMPLLSGISGVYWKHKHDVLHHGHPNVASKDPDVDLWPMASSSADYERAGPLQRWFQRNLQGYLFWPATLGLPTSMRLASYADLARRLRAQGPRRALVVDAAGIAGHYALWLLLPALLWGALPALALYAAVWTLTGPMLAAIFAPAHIGMPVMVDEHRDWRHQFETTRNFRTPRWLSFFYVGLDRQVEHHIFPKIPHQNLRRAAVVVRRWCGEVGLPYHEVGLGEALRSVTAFMHDAWQLDATSARGGVAGRPKTGPARAPASDVGGGLDPVGPSALSG